MTELRLECQGLPCPQPVLQCREAISQSRPEKLIIQVDNEPAKENVTRFLHSQGYKLADVSTQDGLIAITAVASEQEAEGVEPSQTAPDQTPHPFQPETTGQLVFITSSTIGHGDDELGSKLMHNFIATLPEMGSSLWRILLINGGVRLAVQDSPVLEPLQTMERNGVSILVCGTCLGFFQLLDQKAVGQTTNMLDVVTSLQLASKVIKV